MAGIPNRANPCNPKTAAIPALAGRCPPWRGPNAGDRSNRGRRGFRAARNTLDNTRWPKRIGLSKKVRRSVAPRLFPLRGVPKAGTAPGKRLGGRGKRSYGIRIRVHPNECRVVHGRPRELRGQNRREARCMPSIRGGALLGADRSEERRRAGVRSSDAQERDCARAVAPRASRCDAGGQQGVFRRLESRFVSESQAKRGGVQAAGFYFKLGFDRTGGFVADILDAMEHVG